MEKTRRIATNDIPRSEAAVDGLFGGMWAGAAMAVVIIIAGLWNGDTISESISRFSPIESPDPLTAVVTHLALSAVYGLVYAILINIFHKIFRLSGWINLLMGVPYGLLLWLLAVGVWLPVAASSLIEIPPVMLALAHLIYGLILGLYMSVKVRNSEEAI
jgi:hypothetical protein